MYKDLLNAVQAKIYLYEKHKELSGENFNIFSIMSMESDEVFTHSAIIAELLDPKGSHSLGKLPLQLFIKQNFEEDFEFNFGDVKSLKEVFAGVINEDKTEGGRLDIVVINNVGQIFVIENKIYALEQKNQLLRYKNKYPEAKLFYLTLFGVDSKQQTENENNENYTAISYENNILEWLEECVKYAYDKPMVREVLNQYIYLIKKLTNQTTNNEMSEEIIKIINDNFKASAEIFKNFESALKQKQKLFLEKIKKNLESNKDLSINTIQEITLEEIKNSNRLKIYLKNDYFISFHFKSNLGLLLIGNTRKEFNLTDEIFANNFEGFSVRNWDVKTESHYLFWKHAWGHFGNTDTLIKSDKYACNNDEKKMVDDLIVLAKKVDTQFSN